MKDGAQDLWNDHDGPITQPQPQIQDQTSQQIDLRKLAHQSSNQNLTHLNNYSQIRGYRSVPEVRVLADPKRVSTEKPEKRKIWRKNGSSTESESEAEDESQNQSYYSNMGSIASLGKYDGKRERRVMPKTFDDKTDFSEQVQLIKYELNKKKLSQGEENQDQEQENVLTQTRYYYSFAVLEMFFILSLCIDFVFE